jgi:hypothetical protein
MGRESRHRSLVWESASDQLTGFFVFWFVAATVFSVIGVATLVAVHHGRRLGAFFLLLGALSLLPGYAVYRTSHRR